MEQIVCCDSERERERGREREREKTKTKGQSQISAILVNSLRVLHVTK